MSDLRRVVILVLALAVPTPDAAQTGGGTADVAAGQPPLVDVPQPVGRLDGRNPWHLELTGGYFLEAWDLNLYKEQLVGGAVTLSRHMTPNWTVGVELACGRLGAQTISRPRHCCYNRHTMVSGRLTLLALAVVGVLSTSTADAQGGDLPPNNLPNDYITVLNWAKIPDGRRWGSTAGIDVAPDGTIWALDRCGANSCVDSDLDPILHFDPSGRLLGSFGAGLFNVPHGLHVDADGNVWVTNHGVDSPNGTGQQVLKFSPRGEVLMTLGRAGVAGVGHYTFNQPSDVLVAPGGEIFVADGHGPRTNARIVRFTPDGTFIRFWGRHGSGPEELEGPHALAMDSQGRLFVGDRTNNRIQIFDQDGTLLDSWTQFGRPSGLFIDQHDTLYVADSESRDNEGGYGHNPHVRRGIRIGSAVDGTVTGFIPDPAKRGGSSGAEGVAVDHDGNVYGAEVGPHDVKKYIKR